VKEYTEGFKARMVKRMTGPYAVTATALSKETGVPQPTLSLWLRRTRDSTLVTMAKETKQPGPKSAEEKLRLVVEAQGLSGDALGAFLRREGIHEIELEEWRKAAVAALGASSRRGGHSESKRVRELERELRRKDKALAETAALLVLSKKAEALWGAEADDTDDKSEK
jgi:transposase-like protein